MVNASKYTIHRLEFACLVVGDISPQNFHTKLLLGWIPPPNGLHFMIPEKKQVLETSLDLGEHHRISGTLATNGWVGCISNLLVTFSKRSQRIARNVQTDS